MLHFWTLIFIFQVIFSLSKVSAYEDFDSEIVAIESQPSIIGSPFPVPVARRSLQAFVPGAVCTAAPQPTVTYPSMTGSCSESTCPTSFVSNDAYSVVYVRSLQLSCFLPGCY
jgi:hypothetical protein